MDKPVEIIEYRGYQIEIYQDENPESPRNWDNLGTMLCKHRGYNLGDVEISKGMDAEDIKEYVKRKDVVALPLYLLDHSGLWMRTCRFECDAGGWDTSMVGYITVTHERIKKVMARPKKLKKSQRNPDLAPIKRITKKDRERVIGCLEGEVKTYSDYLEGNIVGYIIKKDEEEFESCWGFYPEHESGVYGHRVGESVFRHEFKSMINECESIINYHIKKDEQAREKERKEVERIKNIQENITSA